MTTTTYSRLTNPRPNMSDITFKRFKLIVEDYFIIHEDIGEAEYKQLYLNLYMIAYRMRQFGRTETIEQYIETSIENCEWWQTHFTYDSIIEINIQEALRTIAEELYNIPDNDDNFDNFEEWLENGAWEFSLEYIYGREGWTLDNIDTINNIDFIEEFNDWKNK
tara:strand:+ start:61 stop:552 length:492 start_codon:yes stop_codon:yes gene_type:complete